MAKGTVTVRVVGDARGLIKELDSASDRMRRFGDRMSVTVTPALAALGKASVDAASDLEEATSKAAVVFGKAGREVDRFADSASSALGVSRREALEASATFGNLFNTIGLANDASADMSTTMVRLASDMGSFNNEDPSAMLDRLRSGLAGEAEPLRQFGVMLSAAAVEAEALEMGLAGTAAALTEADKVQARYAIILEQTALQQGDFARTSEGLANQQRILAAEFEDARAELGRHLLPVMKELVGVASGALEAFGNLSEGTQGAIVKLGALAAATGPVISVGTRLYSSLSSVAAMLAATGPFGLAIGAASVVLGLLAKDILDARRAAEDFADAIAIDDTPQERLEALNRAMERQTELAGDPTWEIFGHALRYSSAEALEASKNVDALGAEIAEVRQLVAGQAVGNWMRQTIDDLLGTSLAADDAAGSLDDLGEAAAETGEEVASLTDRLIELSGGQVDLDRATIGYHDTLEEVSEALRNATGGFDLSTDAGRRNREGLLDLIESGDRLVASMVEEGASAEQARIAMQAHTVDLAEAARAAGATEAEVAALIETYNRTPDEIATAVFATGIQSTIADLQRVREAMGEVGSSIEEVAARLNIRVSGVNGPGGFTGPTTHVPTLSEVPA